MKTSGVHLLSAQNALPGRQQKMHVNNEHFVLKVPLLPPYPQNSEKIIFGMGCFWGAERKFWSLRGVVTTAVGYSAGITPNPTYDEVCSGLTGHNEVVLVVYAPEQIALVELLNVFWESHDPTQGMRQGNDIGTQYRSGIYFDSLAQERLCRESLNTYQHILSQNGFGSISTQIQAATDFYFAEDYHQQYLEKNPRGYCGLGGTGIKMPHQ